MDKAYREIPKVGDIWRHCKGVAYEIIAVALDEANPKRELVIYKSVEAERVWARELSNFLGTHPDLGGLRFVKIRGKNVWEDNI